MHIEVRPESASTLGEYSRIPIAFDVSEVFDAAIDGDNRITLTARRLADPYVKDYDAIGDTPMDARADVAFCAGRVALLLASPLFQRLRTSPHSS